MPTALATRNSVKTGEGLNPQGTCIFFPKIICRQFLHQHDFYQVSVQANAASARALFEESYLLREGIISRKEKYPPASIYCKSLFYQYKEWLRSGACPQVGEELFAQAFKQYAVHGGSLVD